MKNIFLNKKFLVLSLALLSFVGCKKTLDINESPNNPSIDEATPEALFPSAVMSTAGRVGGDLAIVGGIWSQFWTQNTNSSQFRTIDAYDLTNTSNFITGPYNELFSGALADYQLGLEKATEKQNWSYYLMNTVMKAYTYQVLVDLYDQVPYTEALKRDTILQPKFDDGYSIYKALLGEIDNALSKDFQSQELSAEQTQPDLVFRGGMDNWVKFANTLKLKMYLRMVNAKPDEAKAGIEALYNAGAEFLDIDAGVNSFSDIPNRSNPFYEYNFRRLNTPDNLKSSVTLTSWLNENKDPRAKVYFGVDNPVTSINQGDYLGGSSHGEYKNALNPVVAASDPVWFISAAESYFMQAEARERYFGGSDAEALYNKGVTAAFAQVGADLGSLLTSTYEYPKGSLEENLEAIIVQKWASFFGSHALEAFLEQNRTGYPQVSPVYSTDKSYIPGQIVFTPNAVTNKGNFPRRYVFPDSEKSRNSNTPKEVPIYTKVWWGK